ncbi:MAG: hypothetical protein IT378_25270 [Sandaracinaceae bacterium]|nr:hypothetical protein [Sandaracinaceae bacterium]
MTIDTERALGALATDKHPADALREAVERHLGSPVEQYEDYETLEKARAAVAELPEAERRERTLAYLRAWDGSDDYESQSRLARAGFAQGIDYHHLEHGEGLGADKLWWPSLAPISCYDVQDLMQAMVFAGEGGDALATLVDYAAFGRADPRVFELMRQAHTKKEEYSVIRVSFGSPRATDDRLLELMLVRPGDPPELPLAEVLARMVDMQTQGALGVETLGVCSRWLAKRGHAPIAPPIQLGSRDSWDGGHAGGAMAAQAFLAHVWSADEPLVEQTAHDLFKRMTHPPGVVAICESLPFEDKVVVEGDGKYWRLYRKGRLVVTHSGAKGKAGRIALKLHPTLAKAQKDSASAVKKKRDELM